MKNNIKAYYNEWDKDAAAWLRQLIKDGLITDGVVDERSITEVIASDIRGFDRVHWFAGIGTWDYCLNEAGWGDRPIWTASLPCQPFSAAGKQLGKADERHLLPHFLGLVRECKPDIVFGEQVARAIQHGWLDDLHTEMEAQNYAVGHVVLGAHSIGAAHIRQRLYWVANSISEGLQGYRQLGIKQIQKLREREKRHFAKSGMDCRMGNSKHKQYEGILSGFREESCEDGECAPGESSGSSAVDWFYCRDGKYRPIKSGIKPLVNGSTRTMVYSSDQVETEIKPNETTEAHAMRLKGYGNAIVSGCAIEFIKTYMEYKNK